MDKTIKQQIELNTSNNKLRMYSFQNPGKGLQELLTMAKTLEETTKQAETLQKASKESQRVEVEVNKVSHYQKEQRYGKNRNFQFQHRMSNNQPKNKICFRCGGSYPHEFTCPAEKKFCNKCGKKGHFAKCCKTKPKGGSNKSNEKKTFVSTRPLNNVSTHSLSEYSDDETVSLCEMDETLFSIQSLFGGSESYFTPGRKDFTPVSVSENSNTAIQGLL